MPAHIPRFESKEVVRVGKTIMALEDVSVGKEFELDGSLYQTSASPTTFGAVPMDTSFRHGEKWYRRVNETIGTALSPNMPFGELETQTNKLFALSQCVFILEITCRGAVEASADH